MTDRLTINELHAMAGAHVPDAEESGPLRHDKPKGCVACGGHHGSVGEGRRCLEAEIRRLRRGTKP